MQMHINKIKGSYNLSVTQRNHRHNLAFLKQLKYVHKNNIDIIHQNTNDFNSYPTIENRRLAITKTIICCIFMRHQYLQNNFIYILFQ